MVSQPLRWFDDEADPPPFLKALEQVRHQATREGWCYHHVQAIMVPIDQYAEAGEPANRDKLSISFNGIRVAKSGARDPSYNEAEVSEVMKNPKIQIKVALGLGKGRDRVLTCDLTKEYVAINGDYRS